MTETDRGGSRAYKMVLAGGFVVVVFGLVLLWGWNRQGDAPAFAEKTIGIGAGCLRVQVADTSEKRSHGLKGRADMDGFDGMIFDFSDALRGPGLVNPARIRFTMAGVRFPLTIGFYDESGRRVDAVDMETCSGTVAECPRYGSKAGFRTAIETPKGKLPDGPLTACPS